MQETSYFNNKFSFYTLIIKNKKVLGVILENSRKILCDLKIPEVYAAVLKKNLKLKATFSAYKNKIYIGRKIKKPRIGLIGISL